MPTDGDAFGGPVWPSLEELEGLFRAWTAAHSETLALRELGRSNAGRPVWALEVTDPAVAADHKQHVLITGLHSGVERSGTTAICALCEWLLGDDSEARQTRRCQRVVCVPVADPDNYVRGRHGPGYTDWTPTGPARPAQMPEAVGIQRLFDELQPEVHADVHGMSLGFAAYHMLENSGASYSNLALQPYHREVCELMDEAALAAGFCSDRPASDDEVLCWGPELEGIADRLWRGRPRYYAALYGYHHYHTMPFASEIGWEESGVARHRALLRLGNAVYPGELYAGYPTRVIASNNYHMVTAYGSTAAARRRSRVELWARRPQMALGMVDPNVEGRAVLLCATRPVAAQRWLHGPDLTSWLGELAANPAVSAEPLRQFFAGWPAGQNGPVAMPYLSGPCKGAGEEAIRHGLCLRLRLFFPAARITELLVNGRPILPSERDGFATWQARGMTFVQIAIPPERSIREDLFVVTCRYDPGVRRTRWSASAALARAAGCDRAASAK